MKKNIIITVLIIIIACILFLDNNKVGKYNENISKQRKIIDSLEIENKRIDKTIDSIQKEYNVLQERKDSIYTQIKYIKITRDEKNNNIKHYNDAKLDSILTNYRDR